MTTLDNNKPKLLSNYWFLVYVLFILLSVMLAVVRYPALPEQIPMHTNMAGEVDRYAPKSFGIFMFMPMLQAVFTFIFLGINLLMARSALPKPNTKNNMYHTLLSPSLYIIGLCMQMQFLCAQLIQLGIIKSQWILFSSLFVLVVIFAMVILLAVKARQGGNQFAHRAETDDSHWVLGLFYYDKGNPSIFVEKRIGLGFTVNLAHPLSWIALLVLLLLIGGILVFAYFLQY